MHEHFHQCSCKRTLVWFLSHGSPMVACCTHFAMTCSQAEDNSLSSEREEPQFNRGPYGDHSEALRLPNCAVREPAHLLDGSLYRCQQGTVYGWAWASWVPTLQLSALGPLVRSLCVPTQWARHPQSDRVSPSRVERWASLTAGGEVQSAQRLFEYDRTREGRAMSEGSLYLLCVLV